MRLAVQRIETVQKHNKHVRGFDGFLLLLYNIRTKPQNTSIGERGDSLIDIEICNRTLEVKSQES